MGSVCAGLEMLYLNEYQNEDEERKVTAISQLSQLIACLSLLVSTSKEALVELLSSSVSAFLPILAREPSMQLSYFRILRAVARTKPQEITTDQLTVLVDMLESICQQLDTKLNEPPPDPKVVR